ncbi:MAG: hypothetical protein KC482_13450 [Dehalococcoidia bacterium]|nr:hypothetical protein [Dehalococcoidia bacterium]MCA9824013.1 hypothetical protein [Dehalococcoidia bacterium]MCA9843079.1 hypothetical protein [Dehalococcoidia bacterium]MCA9854574.1 hypothetical protein [Dehalococcoidia bacterium]
MTQQLRNAVAQEEGHAAPAIAALAAGIGGVVLGIGAANDSGVTAVIGGIVLGVGILAFSLADHIMVDYGMYDRLEKLEGKEKSKD